MGAARVEITFRANIFYYFVVSCRRARGRTMDRANSFIGSNAAETSSMAGDRNASLDREKLDGVIAIVDPVMRNLLAIVLS